MVIETTPDGRYSLFQSRDREKLRLVAFEIEGERHIIDRAPIGGSHWAKWPSFFLEMGAKHLARIEAGFVNAPDALKVLRSVPENDVMLATETEADEWVLRSRVAEALANSLTQKDAFQSTLMFAKAMRVEGFDDLYQAFKDRWRPSVQPTDAMRLISARKMAETMRSDYPDLLELQLGSHSEGSPSATVPTSPSM